MVQKRKSIRIERGNAQRGCRRIGGEKEADETRQRDRGREAVDSERGPERDGTRRKGDGNVQAAVRRTRRGRS